MNHPPAEPPPAFTMIFVPHTLRTGSRSGVQRVVACLAAQLAADAAVELVTWDDVDGRLRFCDHDERVVLFGATAPAAMLRPNRLARAVGRRFQDMVPADRAVCMLLPEISYHLPEGWTIHQRVITQCLEAGWHTAAVLYDLIPILNGGYASLRQDHERYIAQLLRCDLIVAISAHVEAVFRGYVADRLGTDPQALLAAGTRIAAVALPGVAPAAPSHPPDPTDTAADAPPPCIVVLGTVEPRKQQLRVVQCYRRLLDAGTVALPLEIVGALHPDIADAFLAAIAGEPRIHYRGYQTDAQVQAIFRRARFSVFASDDEGFGLPISESLSRSVPCLTADFGAMAEVARDGGCLLVDVRQDAALQAGLASLATDDRLVARLRAEIGGRPRRGWNHYASELLTLVRQGHQPADVTARIRRSLEHGEPVAAGSFGPGSPAIAFCARQAADAKLAADPKSVDQPPAAMPPNLLRVAVAGTLPVRQCVAADVLLLPAADQLDDLIGAVERDPGLGALPGWIDASGDIAQQAALLTRAVALRTRQTVIALRERHFATAVQRLAHPFPRLILSIVISTYNRAAFVAANTAWIIGQMRELGPAVELVVVDNASTDDTGKRLAAFQGAPGVRVVVNPTNVGMLGNLRVCSALHLAEHAWLIGDDDFIMPDVLRPLLRLLTMHRAVPLVLMNFAVYHRAAMSAGDSAPMFIAERQVLAQNPVPGGPMRVIDAGSQHDNLFTAIYPIIFRADLAAAIFNHAFDGEPFRSLVESVPTTKFILENYALADSLWVAAPCVVGNAHNSWQRYRVAWHAMLVPMALRLARRCGMDAHLLRRWAGIHVDLHREAAELFPTPFLAAAFEADAHAASHQVLRRRVVS